ncbi:hypothetical protein JCM10295v2_001100 [Rhodotorula toruloides]
MHSLKRYDYWTLAQGTPANHDTSIWERMHKKVVKDPYRRSNHLLPTEQITRTNMRQDALTAFVVVTALSGELDTPLPHFASARTGLAYPTPFMEMKLRGKTDTHRIYASPSYFSRSTNTRIRRYDPVLILNHQLPPSAGFRAFEIGRVRIFFSIPLCGRELQLALVEDYVTERGGRPLLPIRQPTVRLARLPGGEVRRRVILTSDIYRSVLLLPIFEDKDLPDDLTFANILSRWGEAGGSFAVSVFSDLAMFNLLGPSLMV